MKLLLGPGRCRTDEHDMGWEEVSGGANAVKEHIMVISRLENPLARSPGCTFFLEKFLFSCRPQKHGAKIKQIKRSDIVTFLFSVHTITEAKKYAGLGRAGARAVDLPARSFDLARPGVAPPLEEVRLTLA